MKRAQSGLTKLEFALIATIFALLLGTFLYAVRQQQVQAERLSVELTVIHIRTGLLSEIADRLIQGRAAQTADLVGSNPVRFLKGSPAGYVGEFRDADPGLIRPGNWYFDLGSGELVYRLIHEDGFRRADGQAQKEIRWRIQPRGVASSSQLTVDALFLAPTIQFEWY